MHDLNDFSLIPAGDYEMGDCLHEDKYSKFGTCNVHVSAFYMAKRMVTFSLWKEVLDWAISHGYDFEGDGISYGSDHPVHSIYWYDAIKWCNAKSEMDGQEPVYYTDDSHASIYRNGRADLKNKMVKWDASGYRLPTEAEWEYAARGGLEGKRFPWGDTVTHYDTNYRSMKKHAFDLSETPGNHPKYGDHTSPVASFAPNGYGLYDMVGNCSQWIWDYMSETPVDGYRIDPRGPETGMTRISRGGCWWSDADQITVAMRRMSHPLDWFWHIGMRMAMSYIEGR